MPDATVIGLAKGVTALIQAAIDDPSEPLGAGLTFDLKRVAFLKQWVLDDDDGTIRIRVATHGTEGHNEEGRLYYGVSYVIPVAILRKLTTTEMDGEAIDGEDTELLAVSDGITELVEILTQRFALRANWHPASNGVRFERWTHQDKSNPQGLIFNPAGLKERRQYEATILLHYSAEFAA